MDERTFRDAMATFLTGVAVITTTVNDEIHGMTANALMSVSLSPKLLAISIDEKASMLEKIQKSSRFALSVLGQDQLEISMHFARQMHKEQAISFEWMDGLPVIPNALAQFTCTVDKAFRTGDHMLFLGRVNEIQTHDGKFPLLFYRGKYQKIKQ
ncbi:MAG: flavin reductase family protein [Tuberibacillus sp.]